MIQSRTIYVALGRHGDLFSIMPLMWAKWRRGERPIICVAREFAGTLDGFSYAERLVYDGDYSDVPAALRWLKANRPKDRIVIAQAYMNPVDRQRKTASYQMESWRVAGGLDEFGQHPLVIDRRDPERETAICKRIALITEPVILLALESVSSPFRQAKVLEEVLPRELGSKCTLIDLNAIRGERVYDLIELFDRAACVVAVDTMPLHLARASRVPVVAIINNEWKGSVPPPTTMLTVRYAEFERKVDDIVQAVERVIDNETQHRFVVHVCDLHGDSERHQRARATWDAGHGEEAVIAVHDNEWPRDATAIGDLRKLPYLRDVLQRALEAATDTDDVVVWSNSDVGFESGLFETLRRHAGLWGAASMRRTEAGAQGPHMGREIFIFRADWLTANLPDFPDFILGAPFFDLVLAAFIRLKCGIVSTQENLHHDFWPCDLPPGAVTHESHPSSWSGDGEFQKPANVWNGRLAREWCEAHCPTLKL